MNRAIILESEEKGHGKDETVSTGRFFEDVPHGVTMTGRSDGFTVEVGVCLPEMWL